MVNDLEHAWLAVDRQAIEAARRSGRAKRQRRRPAAPAAELHPDEPPSPWRLLIIGPVSREAGSRPSHLFPRRSEEHTSELQSLMRISYAVFCLKKKNTKTTIK